MRFPPKPLQIVLILAALAAAIVLSVLNFYGILGLRPKVEGSEEKIGIACVGDSVTYGYGVKNRRNGNYPTVLGGLLGERYAVANFGVNGAAVQRWADKPYVKTGAFARSVKFNADAVVLMMGLNDSKTKNWRNVGEFKKEYSALVRKYLEAPNPPKIYVCTLTAVFGVDGKEKFDIRKKQTAEINEALIKFAEENGFEIIDIRALTKELPERFKKDGVHPDADGAAAIAGKIADVLKSDFGYDKTPGRGF